MTNSIIINDLKKTYAASKRHPAKEAIKGISLSVPEGMIYGLLGPNGAGKSTLINILAGLVLKTSGEVIVSGVDIDKDPRGVRRNLGVVPQEVVLDPFFSVREMLEYHAGYYGIPKAERRTDEILEALSLTDKAGVNSRRLSGGMKRRVLIAKALVHTPKILILDEPTAGVDVELRESMWKYVRELNARGTTIVLTTHYLEEAEQLCERVAIINHGEVIVENSTAALKQSFTHKQLLLTLGQELKAVPKSLTALPSVKAELLSPLQLQLCFQSDHIGIGDLLAAVNAEGFVIKDLSTNEADLEDVFRQYTDRHVA